MILFTKATGLEAKGMNLLPLLLSAGLLTGIGVSFALHALWVGHDHVFGTTREVPWGILITPYVFFACMATGMAILSSIGQVFASRIFAPLVNRTVFLAIIAMIAGLAGIGLEIENPWNMGIYGFLTPNPFSNIWWKSSIYTLFLLLMTFNFFFLILGRTKLAWGFATGALIAITCGNLNMNADMALLGARGFWAENYMPLFFLTVSALSACFCLVIMVWLSSVLQSRPIDEETKTSFTALFKLSIVLVVGLMCFGGLKILGGFSPTFTENPEAMHMLVRGDFALNFWGGEILLAGVLPLLLLLLSAGGRRAGLFVLAGVSSLVGIAVTFYDLIVVGQLIPHFQELNLVDYPQFYSYSPTLHEYMIFSVPPFLFIGLFILGEMFFNSAEKRA